LQALGLEGGSTWGNMVSGLLPIASLEAASVIENLNFARGSQSLTNVGSVENDADAAQNADQIRASDGLDGTGITIGIMSDSYDNLNGEAADIASGDLPNNVNVLLDLGSGGIDEGRAMAQLVHDIVPSADLLFRTAFLGQADFANGIGQLVAAGADVITDDIFYFAEPFFQDGVIAQAADQAVADGVAYYTSAGNSSDNSYEATFTNSGQTINYTNGNNVSVVGTFHDFDPGAGVDTVQSLTFDAGGSITLGFQWDNLLSSVSAGSCGAIEDYDILLTDNNGAIIANLTASSSTIGGDPVKIFQIQNNGANAIQANLSIVRTNQGAQATDNFIKYVLYRSGGVTVNEFDTQSSTAVGHSNAAAAVSVGAAFFGQTPEFGVNPPVLESFSSVGRTDILFDTNGDRLATPEQRIKPDLVGVDGSNNTFFGNDIGFDADTNPNFFGTSAAAPNVAAVAAQLLQFNPNLTPDQINTALAATAIDMDDPRTAGFDVGVDEATGAGLIDAAAALEFIRPPSGAIIGTNACETLNGTSGDDIIQGLGGDDTLNGLDGADNLQGGDGADRLFGSSGADTMSGGAGDDRYFVENPGDVVVEAANEGTDTVVAEANFTLSANVENLFIAPDLVGTGNALDNVITGEFGAEILIGLGGDDQLIGQGGSDNLRGGDGDDSLNGGTGSDVMNGGAGDDVFAVDDAGDVVVEAVDDGNDTILASIDFTIADNVETLTLIVDGLTGTGNAANNNIIALTGLAGPITVLGLGGDDQLGGSAGNDLLDGGAGADTMTGRTGDDRYIVDDAGDFVTELSGEGSDTVETSISLSLAPFDNVENLTLTVDGLTGTGNALGNRITGAAGSETLLGGDGDDILNGGAGADAMTGGLGDDAYGVDDVGDTVTELAGEGFDSVETLIDFTLGDNIEALSLAAEGLTGTGNAEANTIFGFTGAETLNGAGGDDDLRGEAGDDILDGGAGADAMQGGAGDDAYTVDDAGDTAVENADEGTDSVTASVSFTLGANLENLTLAGQAADHLSGTGNALANAITGDAGDNQLSGGDGDDVLDGGAGADTLTGGLGDDRYIIEDITDTAVENADEGTDTVAASADHTLADNFENLEVSGGGVTGTGNRVANQITGGAGSQTLFGLGGSDRLDGGAGADTMAGGIGNDVYVVDDEGDVVTEAPGEGTDTVQTTIDFTLGDDFEILTLLAPALIGEGNAGANRMNGSIGDDNLRGGEGSDDIRGSNGDDLLEGGPGADRDRLIDGNGDDRLFGNRGDDVLVGGDGDDQLVGQSNDDTLLGGDGDDLLDGGFADDLMIGGDGDDIYKVDSAQDRIIEAADEGNDTVLASISFRLAVGVENLTLTVGGLTGEGTIGANTLTGSSGADTLDGGFGSDVLNGGNGDDILIGGVGDRRDTLIGAGGNDDIDGGEGDDRLFGNSGNDTMVGGAGADFIYAQSGDDQMEGGAGADIFQFRSADGDDFISDFTVHEDTFLAFGFGFASGADVFALARASGGDTVIDLPGGGTVTLTGVALASLDADDFDVA
jgi:Ca2+-binding RTX toxin-like protein